MSLGLAPAAAAAEGDEEDGPGVDSDVPNFQLVVTSDQDATLIRDITVRVWLVWLLYCTPADHMLMDRRHKSTGCWSCRASSSTPAVLARRPLALSSAAATATTPK